ncbi:MAG TPA: EamA family transporter [Alphaproteobacteria bacterium]|nr:EamA family transporter [Alphaproteobacteria bacterium]USO06130.1 MAG: EamA family transporter [Rhodospirillales bacterium]HOO82072.1 EamA family transporter [Alphaproteobacteria bacterium]
MHWLVYALVVIAGGLGIHSFSKLAKSYIDPVYTFLLAGGVFFTISILTFLIMGGREHIAQTPTKGIILALCTGVAMTAANFGVFLMYKAGAPMSVAMPLTRTSTAILAVLFGVFFFAEKLTLVNMTGVVFAVIGIVLITR